MENHDEAYHRWREAGLQERTLVHIDAHDDLLWVQGQWRLSAQEAWQALKVAPGEVYQAGRRFRKASRRFWRQLIGSIKSRLPALEAK